MRFVAALICGILQLLRSIIPTSKGHEVGICRRKDSSYAWGIIECKNGRVCFEEFGKFGSIGAGLESIEKGYVIGVSRDTEEGHR